MPLAYNIRPKKLKDFIGQAHLVGKNGPIKKFIENQEIPSMIFWGPPGSGKTTLAEIIANEVDADFLRISAVTDRKEKLRKVIGRAEDNEKMDRKTILFIDEIHRWNKAQQDALLPHVESGKIVLIGATTENPSFSVISPLISRSRVFVFEPHTVEQIVEGLERAVKLINSSSVGQAPSLPMQVGARPKKITVSKPTLKQLAEISDGDIRFAISSLEIAINLSKSGKISKKDIENAVQKSLRFDRKGEEHYNIISAVHKSIRSSDATAGTYWVMRMLSAGEDPLYIARRLIRFAAEDIGTANPNALLLANQVWQACKNIGMPECDVHLVMLVQYLAESPKDNSAYIAKNRAMEDIKKHGSLPIPMNIRNAPTKLMKELGYGEGYEYDHDLKSRKSDQQLLPDELKDRDYFEN